MVTRRLNSPLLGALLPLLVLACKSAQAFGEDADREVYEILAEQRAKLGAGDAFTLERPATTLRTQLDEQRSAGTEAPLTLDLVGCLRAAAENSREWQDERERLYRSALDLTLQRWNFSVQQNGTFSAFLAGTGGQSESGGFLSNLNLFKLLGVGTALVGDIGIDLVRDVGSGNGWDAISHLKLNITQPILRGFGRDIVREPLTQAERDIVYQARSYERFRRTFAVAVAQRFFTVLELVDRLKNEEANYTNLTELRKRNEALAEAGRLTDIQVDQARQDEFSAQDRLVAAHRDLAAALDDFKFQMGLPIETELTLEEGGLRSLEHWQAFSAPLEETRAIQIGLEERLDHQNARDAVLDAERAAHVAADALRMGFDVSATAEVASEPNRQGSLAIDDMVWSAGFDLDLPIDRLPERNAYRNALIAHASVVRAAEASVDRVTSELRDALRRLEAARASYDIQSGSVVLAERRVESAALNLDAGRASTRDVLEAQESRLQAQNTLSGALTDTILAGLFLYRDLELLEITEQGFELEPRFVPPDPLPEPRS